ncbi:hypothetical protein [Roseibium sp. M-1]
MSETAHETRPRGPSLETAIILVICAVVLVGGWYVLSQRQQTLRQSPAGLDGLQVWLASNRLSAQNFAGGWPIDETTVGLLIVPLYDTLPETDRVAPQTKEELLLQQDEFDLTASVINRKAERVTTLVVLPKWRSGMRLTGLAHPVLKVEKERLNKIVRKLTGDKRVTLSDARVPFTVFGYDTEDGEDLRADIYAAQTFSSNECIPVIGTADAMLLAECPLDDLDEDALQDTVLILSDPDLINNHGLRLGDNARIALDFIGATAGKRTIIIDYSRSSWLRDPTTQPERKRTWDDLARFFGPPFLTLWIGAAILLALAVWRAALRYGPVLSEDLTPGAGKDVAVRARARLMRRSGQDGALTREYASARIAATASALFGPGHARHYSGEEAFVTYAERRHPALAPRLRGVLDNIRKLPARLTAGEAIHHIDQLELILEQITHDA